MPLTMVILGFGLVLAGIFFAVGGIGNANATGSGLKSFTVQGPSWLILVAFGVAVIMGGGYLYKEEQSTDTVPAATLPPVDDFFEPFGFGDDVFLDDLWESCADADWSDCDELFQQSPVDSDYERFGATCGGLIEDDGLFCVDAAEAGTLAEFEKLPNSD